MLIRKIFLLTVSVGRRKTKNKTRYYYSTIKKKKSVATRSNMGEEPTLGFEFQTWIINGAGYRAVSVLYVLPGSPAEKKVCGVVTGFIK